jgi:hypothetical protein
MPVCAKPNNHAVKPQAHDANHSVPALLSHTFASSKTNSPTDSTRNKVKDRLPTNDDNRTVLDSFSLVQSSPCRNVDGAHPLAITNKGFLMCDGERMFVESCPGGTIWDDINKSCVWPDMQGTVSSPLADQVKQTYGQQAYSEQTIVAQPTYGQQIQMDSIKPVTSYGAQQTIQKQQDFVPAPQTSSYGAQQTFQKQQDFVPAPQTSSYGAQQTFQKQQDFIPMQKTNSYGSQQQTFQQPIQKQQDFRPMQQTSSY